MSSTVSRLSPVSLAMWSTSMFSRVVDFIARQATNYSARMKTVFLVTTAALLAGCVTDTGQRMSAEDLASIVPGKTTREEMTTMFGEPGTIGVDAEGRTFAQYINLNLTTAPFHYDHKTQMLVVIYTNDVVFRFDKTDQLNSQE